MKRMILMLAFVAPPLLMAAREEAKNTDITGSWKETRRMNRGNLLEEYTDTTYYDFLIGNEYTTQRKNSFMYRGTYKVSMGRLDLGMRSYNIQEMSPAKMVLKDDGGVYVFERYDKAAAMAENNNAATHAQRAAKEDFNADAAVEAGQLRGKWEAYKRTSSVTLESFDYETMLRMMDIKMERGALTGGVYSAKDIDGKPSWTVARYDNNILHLIGRNNRQLKVLRANGNEVIVQEGTITYFFKEFK